ncbi:MAG: tyrosine/serine/threonine protein phosphatase pps1 [Candelina mexicana]|nr:MAG: tyrosine/serine/threonine protein phosphatase pps1 [Candelina mexicana]
MPAQAPATPPASPPSKHLSIQTFSILYPPETYTKVVDSPPVYSIDGETLAAALEHLSTQALPDPKQVFPWLHGLHPDNQIQLAFFVARRRSLRRTPKCIRGITIVKVGGDLTISKIKGAIAPEEILSNEWGSDGIFLEANPMEGFSVRNFQIQASKMAMVSDIVVYAEDETHNNEMNRLAQRFANAQKIMRESAEPDGKEAPVFSTFVLSSTFREVEKTNPEIISIDSKGRMTDKVMDFFHWERREMCTMSKASAIANNVWLGPTPDSPLCPTLGDNPEEAFDVLVEASDMAQVPSPRALKHLGDLLEETGEVQHLEFPSSGSIMPPTWSQAEVDGLMDTCRWIHNIANPASTDQNKIGIDRDGDTPMKWTTPEQHKVLIHCADGYTESSLLGLAYFMFAEGVPVHEAWLRLHCEKQRNFFAYPSDVALLTSIQGRILQESPRQRDITVITEPAWLSAMDGSLPSRILPHMYLGNLNHANNPDLLNVMGIRQILSVGETVSWAKEEDKKWGGKNLLFIDRVQDNGVDPLTDDFDKCLKFLEKGRAQGTATLVHCRVGVSRSATICIAEVMSRLGLSFPRA